MSNLNQKLKRKQNQLIDRYFFYFSSSNCSFYFSLFPQLNPNLQALWFKSTIKSTASRIQQIKAFLFVIPSRFFCLWSIDFLFAAKPAPFMYREHFAKSKTTKEMRRPRWSQPALVTSTSRLPIVSPSFHCPSLRKNMELGRGDRCWNKIPYFPGLDN